MIASPHAHFGEILLRMWWKVLSSQLSGRETHQNQPYCITSPQPSPKTPSISRSIGLCFGPMKMR